MKIILLPLLLLSLATSSFPAMASHNNSAVISKFDFEDGNLPRGTTPEGSKSCEVVSNPDIVLNGKHSLLIDTMANPNHQDVLACTIPFRAHGLKGARFEADVTYRILQKRSEAMNGTENSNFFVSVPWQGKRHIRSGTLATNKTYTETYHFTPQKKDKVNYILMLGCWNGAKVVVDDITIREVKPVTERETTESPQIIQDLDYTPYGIDIGKYEGDDFSDVDRASEAGFQWVRINVQWRDFEPTIGSPPTPAWHHTVELANYVNKKGMHVFLHIGNGFNAWQVAPLVPGAPKRPFARKVVQTRAWHRFLTALVKDFGGVSNHVELMNEINNSGYYPNYDEYIKFYIDTAKFIKKLDPAMKTTPHAQGDGGMDSAKNPSVPDSLVKLYENGAGPWIDFIDIHAYLGDVAEYAYYVDRAYDVAEKAGFPKTQIWISEAGMNLTTHSESEQADFVVKLYKYLLPNPHLAKLFVFSLLDTRSDKKYGIMQERNGVLVPREAYTAFKKMPKHSLGSRPINRKLEGL